MAQRKARMSRRQEAAEKWRPLYEAADRIKKLAPWDWMEESDIFGVQDPESGEIGFVSVMGLLGEHLCVAVYLGANALNQFWALSEMDEIEDAMEDELEVVSYLLSIPQMQASFEFQDMVTKEDAQIMRRLKLKYNDSTGFPIFRNIHPGCPPDLLDVDRIPFLTLVLEQTLDVASRFEEDENLLYPDSVGDEEMYLLRVASEQDGKLVWRDEIMPFPEPQPTLIAIDLEEDAYEALQNAPRVGNSVEIDVFMMPTPIEERGLERPFFPYPLLIVDSDSGFVLAHEMLTPLPSLEAMYSQVPQKVIDLLLQINILPHEIHVQREGVSIPLGQVFNALNVPVVNKPSLPMLTEAKMSMLGFLHDDSFEDDF